ncbi:MAG: hypothetical protein ACE5K4_02480 [Candidatus Hydrothermarchaeota archaeon]
MPENALEDIIKQKEVKTIVMRDDSSFFKSLGLHETFILFIILKDGILSKDILKLREIFDRKSFPYIDYVRTQVNHILSERKEPIYISVVLTENIFDVFCNSPEYTILMNRDFLRGEFYKRRDNKTYRIRRVLPYDVAMSTEEGLVTFHQIFLEFLVNEKIESEKVIDYLTLAMMRNMLLVYNVYEDDKEAITEEYKNYFPKSFKLAREILEGDEKSQKLLDFPKVAIKELWIPMDLL